MSWTREGGLPAAGDSGGGPDSLLGFWTWTWTLDRLERSPSAQRGLCRQEEASTVPSHHVCPVTSCCFTWRAAATRAGDGCVCCHRRWRLPAVNLPGCPLISVQRGGKIHLQPITSSSFLQTCFLSEAAGAEISHHHRRNFCERFQTNPESRSPLPVPLTSSGVCSRDRGQWSPGVRVP